MKRQTFNVLFFIRKTKLKKSGETPIMLRITIEGQLIELQLKRDIMPTQWNQAKERCTGKDATSMEINRYLERSNFDCWTFIGKWKTQENLSLQWK